MTINAQQTDKTFTINDALENAPIAVSLSPERQSRLEYGSAKNDARNLVKEWRKRNRAEFAHGNGRKRVKRVERLPEVTHAIAHGHEKALPGVTYSAIYRISELHTSKGVWQVLGVVGITENGEEAIALTSTYAPKVRSGGYDLADLESALEHIDTAIELAQTHGVFTSESFNTGWTYRAPKTAQPSKIREYVRKPRTQ
jgi:hypothetical protein